GLAEGERLQVLGEHGVAVGGARGGGHGNFSLQFDVNPHYIPAKPVFQIISTRSKRMSGRPICHMVLVLVLLVGAAPLRAADPVVFSCDGADLARSKALYREH